MTHEVVFKRSGISVQIPHNANLLAFVDDLEGIRIPALCRGGSCGTCKVQLLAGRVELETVKALSPQDRKQGRILACSSRVISDLVVDV